MKRLTFTLTALLLVAMTAFTSCEKEELTIDEPTSIVTPNSKADTYTWHFFCGNSNTGEKIKVNYDFIPATYYLWENGQWKNKSHFEAVKWCQENTPGHTKN